jgi:hypothetical protein
MLAEIFNKLELLRSGYQFEEPRQYRKHNA